jgi:fructose-1,6-bisphosphatase I
MVCAGYCCYGSATELVTWYGFGVQRFTLDPSIGEFILTALDLRIPASPKTIYSINDGNYVTWDENMQRAVDKFKFNEPTPYTARYVGSMVADVHRTILYGGIYLYPADKKKGPPLPPSFLTPAGNGKLRILYEGFPMSLLVERAGGRASTGLFRGEITELLDLVPRGIHDKCPVILGCSRDVVRVLGEYA